MSQIPKNSTGPLKGGKRFSDTEHVSVVPLRASDTLEDTMPPAPLRELLAAEGASVYVLTSDAGLFETVEQGGGDHYPVFLAKSWTELRDAVSNGRCGIALLDLDAVGSALVDRINEITRLSPALVTLIASSRERADGLLELLSQRKIHRLLIKPPTVGITRLLLESSVNRHMELKRRPELRTRPVSASGGVRWSSWLLASGLVVGLLVAGGAMVYLSRSETGVTDEVLPSAQQPVSTAPIETPAAAVAPATVLPSTTRSEPQRELGGQAVLEDAALDAAAPTNEPAAVAGPFPSADFSAEPAGPTADEIEARYAAIEVALVADDLDTAEGLLGELATLDPDASRLTFLNAQLARAREVTELAAAAEAAAQAAAAAANPSELTSLIGLARARLAGGQLTAPAGDNAVTYLVRARALDASPPEVVILTEEIGAALIASAVAQIDAGSLDAAEDLLLRAQGLGVTDGNVAAIELSLNVAREAQIGARQDALLATAAERRSQGALFEPTGASAVDALLEARGLNPEHPGLSRAVTGLEMALSSAAATAITVGDWNRSAAMVDALARLGAAEEVIEPLRADIAFGRLQETYLTEPAPATELEVLEFAPPIYPERALTRGTEGWVALEFIVDQQGRPRDLVVTAAEPPGEFDTAALAAVGNYVFVPFERDGRIYERRISLRLRFALE